MPTPIQKLTSYVGISKQAAKGSGASTPATYGFGVNDGSILTVEIEENTEEITLGTGANNRITPGAFRTAAQPGAAFKTRAYSAGLPLLTYAALGAKAVTGAGPYTHVMSPAATLPSMTLFAQYGASEYEKLVDAFLDELTISWDEANPVEVDTTWLGITPTVGTSSFTATTDLSTATPLSPVGGTLQLSIASGTPAAANVKAAEIKITNGLEGVMLSNAVLPYDVFPSVQAIEGSITIVPLDFTDWNKYVTGNASGTGTAVGSSPVIGSLSLALAQGSDTHTFAASRVLFAIDYPDSDPGGGAMELECSFRVLRPTSATDAFTATHVNTVVSY